MISSLIRKVLYKHRVDSEHYIAWLRGKGMRIGDRVLIQWPRSVTIDETRPWLIEIGNDVQVANGVTILTHGYDWSVLKGKYGDVLGSAGKVTIGNNVFIGNNAIILKGVTIGDNVIIGAGAVVTRDIPADSVAAGNPARVIMSLDDYHKKRTAAQYHEAVELVANYRQVYGEDPDNTALAEFFWLFTDSDKDLDNSWEEKMRLVGNREKSAEVLNARTPMFENKQAFLERGDGSPFHLS